MHVWKVHAVDCVGSTDGVGAATQSYAKALVWADGVIPADDALEDRFWDVFFDAAWSTDGDLTMDLADCDQLDGELQDRCRHALPMSLQRALNRADRKPPGSEGALDVHALCYPPEEASVRDRIAAAVGVRYAPAPQFDSLATRFIERRCAGAPPRSAP